MRITNVKGGSPHFMFQYTSSQKQALLVPTFRAVNIVGRYKGIRGVNCTTRIFFEATSSTAGIPLTVQVKKRPQAKK